MCLHGPRVPCTVSSRTGLLSSSGTRRFNTVYAKPVFSLDLERFHPRSQPFTLRRVPRINDVHSIPAQSPKQAFSQDFLLNFYVLLRSFSTILATWPIQRNFLNWILAQCYLTSSCNEIVVMFHPKLFNHFISLRSKCFCEHFVSKYP